MPQFGEARLGFFIVTMHAAAPAHDAPLRMAARPLRNARRRLEHARLGRVQSIAIGQPFGSANAGIRHQTNRQNQLDQGPASRSATPSHTATPSICTAD